MTIYEIIADASCKAGIHCNKIDNKIYFDMFLSFIAIASVPLSIYMFVISLQIQRKIIEIQEIGIKSQIEQQRESERILLLNKTIKSILNSKFSDIVIKNNIKISADFELLILDALAQSRYRNNDHLVSALNDGYFRDQKVFDSWKRKILEDYLKEVRHVHSNAGKTRN